MAASAPQDWLSRRQARWLTLGLLGLALLPPLGLVFTRAGALPLDGVDLAAAPMISTDSSRLYFRNVRSVFYRRAEAERSKAVRYTLRDPGAAAPLVGFVLVDWWMADRAAIVVQTSAAAERLAPRAVRWLGEGGQRGEIPWQVGEPRADLRLAGALYRALAAGRQLTLVGAVGQAALWPTDAERRAARRALRDYFELIDLL